MILRIRRPQCVRIGEAGGPWRRDPGETQVRPGAAGGARGRGARAQLEIFARGRGAWAAALHPHVPLPTLLSGGGEDADYAIAEQRCGFMCMMTGRRGGGVVFNRDMHSM
jgi:hypothetical protein